MMWRILRIAIPGIIQKGIPNLTNSILLRFMAGYGAAPVAVFSLFGRQSSLLLAPAGGLSVTAPAMVGQNLGAGQPARGPCGQAHRRGYRREWGAVARAADPVCQTRLCGLHN